MTLTARSLNWTPRLGVNIDHFATLRQLRGTPYPNLIEVADLCVQAGAKQITVHLREDRRHIQDNDVKALRAALGVPMNLEMAISDAIVRFALKVKPEWACLVPEKRQEVTTEGGLDLKKNFKKIKTVVQKLKKSGIKVSLFIEPSPDSIRLSRELGVDAVELHTGKFCIATQNPKPAAKKSAAKELERIRKASILAAKFGLHAHAGHGIDYDNIRSLVDLRDEEGRQPIEEYNIGHSLVCRAAVVGIDRAVKEMTSAIEAP